MKKYIITEKQLNNIMDNIISEEIHHDMLTESSQIMGLKDLAEIVGRLGFDEEGVKILHKLFMQAYRINKDEGVVEMFKDATNLKIEPISRGKYILSYS